MRYIKELGTTLQGRLLEIWEGRSGLGAEVERIYRDDIRNMCLGRADGACIHLGMIVETAPCGCEAKHVHLCTHPDAEYDRCTRGAVRGSPYPSCTECGGNPTGLKELE